MCSTHLSSSVHFVGQLHLVEAHGCFHPVSPEVGRVGVDVDAAVAPPLATALRPPSRHPLPVYELPAAAVGRHEVEQEGVHRAGVQARHADLQDGKHPAAGTQTGPNPKKTQYLSRFGHGEGSGAFTLGTG